MDLKKIQTEQDVDVFLNSIDNRLKELGRRQGIAHFHQLLGEDHEDLESLNTEFNTILLNDTNDTIIHEWQDRLTDPKLKRRMALFSDTVLNSKVSNNPDLFEISHPLEKTIIQFQPEIDGQRISRSDQGKILETEPDRDKREKVYQAGKVLDDQIEGDLLRLFAKRNELARDLGYPDYVALGLKLQDLDEVELQDLFHQVRDLTEGIWADTLRTIQDELGVSSVQPWDLSYYFHTVLQSPPTDRFPKAAIIPTFRQVLKQAGGDLDTLPIKVVERDIPYGGLCMGIEFGKDIRILANPRDGLLWYDALFHEFGHGIQGSLLDASSYIVASGDPPFFWEGVAGIYERLIHEESVLSGAFRLTKDEIEQLQYRTRLTRILWFRRIAVSCLLEWAVYRGDANPRKTQVELTKEYLGITLSDTTGWAGNTLYTTHPLYNQNYLLMDVMALQTIEVFRSKYGRYPDSNLFDFVNTHYIEPAGWIPWREKIKSATGSALSADALGRYLVG
jgi:oligoendopeptidase F